MALVNNERFVQILQAAAPGSLLRMNLIPYLRDNPTLTESVRYTRNVDRDSALQVLAQIKGYITRYGWLQGKALRPWEIDTQLYARMDRTQPWWGFEFETGYQSNAARTEVIEHVWDTWDNVVFDSEGEGNAGVEITFAPEEMSKYEDGTAQAIQFSQYLESVPNLTMKTNLDNIGCHINLSLPELTAANSAGAAWSLARSVAHLPMKDGDIDVRKLMFGRSDLYGGFFRNSVNDSVWIEGKLFRTTYEVAQFKTYIKTCRAITKALQATLPLGSRRVGNNPDAYGRVNNYQYPFVTNLYEMFNDETVEPIIEWGTYQGEIDGVRGNRLLNGPLARDRVEEKPVGGVVGGELNVIAAQRRVAEVAFDRPFFLDNDAEEEEEDEDDDAPEYLELRHDDPRYDAAAQARGWLWCVECHGYHDPI